MKLLELQNEFLKDDVTNKNSLTQYYNATKLSQNWLHYGETCRRLEIEEIHRQKS